MSRRYDDYLDENGYNDMMDENRNWDILTLGNGRRQRPIFINDSGVAATFVKTIDDDYQLWPIKLHKGDKAGHQNIRYSDGDEHHEKYIHRLVAESFIDNPDPVDKPNVLHYDDDPRHNAVENLRWGDQKENNADSKRNGNFKEVRPEDREKGLAMIRKPVVATNLTTGEVLHFVSIAEAARKLMVHPANIYKVIMKQRKATGGWYFEWSN